MKTGFSTMNETSVCPDEASVYVRQVFESKIKQLCSAVALLTFLPWSVPLFLGPTHLPAYAFREYISIEYSNIFTLS